MRKRVSLLFALIAAVVQTWAAKAISTPLSYSQPDGTTITVHLHGDEFFSWFTTADDVVLTRIDGAFFVSELIEGELRATSILAHNSEKRDAEETALVSKQRAANLTQAMSSEWSNRRRIQIADNTPPYFPHSGSPKVLVVLAEYSDQPFTLNDPKSSFNQFFNVEGEESHENLGNRENLNYYSLREYFRAVSHDQYAPDFTVVGPVKVGEMADYGGTNSNGTDEKVIQLVVDAVTAAHEAGTDITAFDNNGDNRLDLVFVIFSGYSQNAGGDPSTVWAKTGSISKTVAGTQLTWYSCSSELNLYPDYYKQKDEKPYINGIGVPCHEMCHALGLPDIYPLKSSAYVNNQEMEYWDIMDAGEYIANGYRPRDFTAWEAEVMGWSEIETLNDDTEISLQPLLEDGKGYKFVNPNDDNEYFVLENVQARGLNRSFPGHGLIVYHVNYPGKNVTMSNAPNNICGKPGMAIVPADGVCLSSYIPENMENYRASHAGDSFPGSQNVTTLNYTQELPNYSWHTGNEKVLHALTNIVEDDSGTVTLFFTTNYDLYPSAIPQSVVGNNPQTHFNLLGQPVANPENGIFVVKGKKILK